MTRLTLILLSTALVLGLVWTQSGISESEARAGGSRNAFVVRLLGTAQARSLSAEEIAILDADQVTIDNALCFDLDLVDPESGRVIGQATDCLLNISEVDPGLFIEAATFFHFPEGSIVAAGMTTVQPTTGGSTPVTHITGSIPTPDENSVLHGTNRFSNASGEVRLSGAVNLTNVDSGEITFDCLFVLDLD
jgi:hypothetical protein